MKQILNPFVLERRRRKKEEKSAKLKNHFNRKIISLHYINANSLQACAKVVMKQGLETTKQKRDEGSFRRRETAELPNCRSLFFVSVLIFCDYFCPVFFRNDFDWRLEEWRESKQLRHPLEVPHPFE
jgi:hypothetical protein